MKLKKAQKALLASYARSILGATLALYLAGVTDPAELWKALIGALLPVVIRYVNPNDVAFGRLPAAKAVDAALDELKKKPIKKAAPKKK